MPVGPPCGWATRDSTNSKSLLPIQVSELAVDETQVGETYAVRASYTAISVTSGAPTGFSTEPGQSDYVSWTRFTYHDTTGSLSMVDRYHDIPSSGTGTLSTNFYRTVQQTDALGRNEYTINVVSGSTAANRKEQVTQQVYDVRDRVIRIRQGVSGDSAANSHNMTDDYDAYPTMTTIGETIYDNNGIGDGHVTQTGRFHGTGFNDYTGTNLKLTYRGHVRGQEPFYMNGSTETASTPVTVMDVNWQGQTTASAQFIASPTWSTVLTGDGYTDYATSTTTNRRALSETSCDDLDRAYRADTYAIGVSSGAKGYTRRTDMFYDRRGNVVASGDLTGGTATEMAYDGAGRQYQTRTVLELETTRYSGGAFAYRDPVPQPTLASMSGGDDKVITLSHSVFDAAGNATEQHTFDMNHNDTGASAGIDLTGNDDYVRSTVYSWYDAADRITTLGNYGSGDTTAGAGKWKYTAIPTRPGTAPTSRSDTVLVTAYNYDSATGQQSTVTDGAGRQTKTFHDDLGQTTWVAENYDNFDPATLSTISDGTDSSKDRVTQTTYDGAGNTVQLTAYNGSSTATQKTVYLFEDSVAVNRNTSTIYPDSSDTTSAGTDQVKQAYNADGSLATRTDQRGTVIAFAYDSLRRPQSQKVTTLGGSTDGTIRAITTGYDSLGRTAKITSHGNQTDDPANTTDVENQIVYTYNNLSQITKSEQSHSGVVSGTTPAVQYDYSISINTGVFNNANRLETLTYPSGRAVYSNYGTANALEDRLNTPQKLVETNNAGTQLVQYSHTGSGRTVITNDLVPDIKLDLFQGTTSTYAGLDRFGRTIDHRWVKYTSGTVDVARYKYGYDYNSNRTWKEDTVAATNSVNLDEYFTYDGLNRLTSADRGDLNGTRTAISTLGFGQTFGLDQLNNWEDFTQDDDGNATDDLVQARTHNDVNEITETTGPSWTTPAHDAAGNMSTIPKPTTPSSSYSLTWDAWNRLVKVEDATSTVAEYGYDGLNRRILKNIYSGGTLDHTRHIYLSTDWQTLEERVDSSTDPDRQFTWGTRYVDDLVFRTRDTDANGTLDETLYALQDANWHITATADATGTITERLKYDPYGKSTILEPNFTPDPDNTSDTQWEYRFTSREQDEETGLDYFRNRYYHGELGRFISRDPLQYVDGGNLYCAYFVPSGKDPRGMAWYGNFCGPGGGGIPINGLDACCQTHDLCYGRARATWTSALPFCGTAATRVCDVALCGCARRFPCATLPTTLARMHCSLARDAIMLIFCP